MLMFSPMFVLHQIGAFRFLVVDDDQPVILLTFVLVTDREYLTSPERFQYIEENRDWLAFRVFLYVLFFVGNYLSRIWFDFAGPALKAFTISKAMQPGSGSPS